MELCIDIGNTNVKFGFYEGDKIKIKSLFPSHDVLSPSLLSDFIKKTLKDHELASESITDIIISSVVPSFDSFFKKTLSTIFTSPITFLTSINPLSLITADVEDPSSIGSDLICDLVMGISRYHYPLLVIDLGTVSKFLVVNNNGQFATCSFFPGLARLLLDLNQTAALLPKLNFYHPQKLSSCKKTEDAMNSGVIYGMIATIDGLVKQYEQEFGYSFKVVITGGASFYFESFLISKYTFDSSLSLDGLHLILEKIKQRKI